MWCIILAQSVEAAKIKKLDPEFRREILKIPGADKILLCFQCGTCTADCPISRFSDFYRPRKMAHMVQLGLKDRLLLDKNIWLCTTCYTCIDNCPQGVEIATLVRILRNLSVKYTNTMPLVYWELAENLMKTGLVYVIPQSRIRRREQRGLPPLPKTKSEEVSKILEMTELTKIIEGLQTFEKVE